MVHSLGPDPGLLIPPTLSALYHALGYSKVTTLMTCQPKNPQDLCRGRLDSGKTKLRLMRVFGASSLGAGAQGRGKGMAITNMHRALVGSHQNLCPAAQPRVGKSERGRGKMKK